MRGNVDDPDCCLLCGEQARAGECVSTGAFLTRRDPLWRYAGRRLHAGCFRRWDRRAEFVHKFNTVMAGQAVMHDDGVVVGLE
jgi:hypothetical protein